MLEFSLVSERFRLTAAASRRREGFDCYLCVCTKQQPRFPQYQLWHTWSLRVMSLRRCHLGISLFFWGTSMPMSAAMAWRHIIGRNSLPDLNPSGVLFLDFWASRVLSITNTMFVVHKCAWYQATLGRWSMVSFVVVSSDRMSWTLG